MEKQLCLLWQNVSSGQRYHIGDLTLKESGTYAFNLHSRVNYNEECKKH